MGETAGAAIRPANLYSIYSGAGAQPEMHFRGIGGAVAAAGPYLADLLLAACREGNARADRIASAWPPEAAQRDPVTAGRAVVMQQQRGAFIVYNEQVLAAIAVVVSHRNPAADDPAAEIGAGLRADLLEAASPSVVKELR